MIFSFHTDTDAFSQHNASKMQKVQNLALKIMTGALPKSPAITLNKLANIPHIVSFIRGEAAKGASRLQGYGDWTGEKASSKGTIL